MGFQTSRAVPLGGRKLQLLLMTEFLVWNRVLLLPSLMVPPICPGLCSGMSMTWRCWKTSTRYHTLRPLAEGSPALRDEGP